MKHFQLLLVCAVLAGCKIVYDDEQSDEIPTGPDGDIQRNSARLNETFESKLLPLVTSNALGLSQLRKKVTENLDDAGEAHGNRGAGMGAAWNFSVSDTGTVINARLDSSARNLQVDIDSDGTADATVQLGPVIRGTALRDVAPFYRFDDFRDQIEFAKLARAINDKIKPTLIVPEGELAGRTVLFTGVVALKKPTDKMVVTPLSVEFTQ